MKPCKTCGSTQVTRSVTQIVEDRDQEMVIVDCASCENRRHTYYRKKDRYPSDCGSCLGYGHFDADGNRSLDKRDRKCLDCNGTGEHPDY